MGEKGGVKTRPKLLIESPWPNRASIVGSPVLEVMVGR